MKPAINIQQATAADFRLVADIYNEYILQGNSSMEEALHTPETIKGWVDRFHDRERLLVLKEGDTVIGWGIIKRYSDRHGYRFACETAVYITESRLYKGYGTLMKKHLIQVCKELNYKHLVAKIFATNTASIVYNEKLGYTIVGKQHQIGYKNNEWMDVVIMQYIIE